MPTRWEVERAVLYSDLPAPSRLLMFVLLAKSDADTAVIPAQHSPSLVTLAAATGLGKSTVAAHLDSLDGTWVARDRPDQRTRRERTRYAMTIPAGLVSAVQEPDRSSSPGAGPVQEQDCSSSPGAGLLTEGSDNNTAGREQSSSGSSPGAGHAPNQLPNNQTNNTSGTKRRTRKPEPDRPDVDKICNHLADRIVANGSKRPTITEEWRRQARLLLDEERDPPVTVEKVIKAIDWCQDDDFWRANILSMPKLRQRYDQLRLASLRAGPRPAGRHQAYRDPVDPATAYSEGL